MTFSLVDTFFIGMLGTEQLAAIGFTIPVIFIVMNFSMGLTIGLSSVLAKTLGSGNHHLAARITTDNLILSTFIVCLISFSGLLTISPLFTLLGADPEILIYINEYMQLWYLGVAFLVIPMVGNGAIRATGDMKTPSVIMIIAGGLNGILDPFFIFGIGPFPEMGMRGAAVATLIAWAVTFVAAIWILRVREKLITYKLPTLQEVLASWQPVLYIGIPAAVTNLLIPLATGVLTAIVANYGPEAVAAFGVGSRIEVIAMVVIMSLSTTMQPFIGQNLGAGKLSRIREAISISFKFTLWFQFLIYGLLILFSGLIASTFSDDPEVIKVIVLFLLIVPVSYAFQGLQMVISSVLNALNQPIDAMFLSIIRLFVFYIPFAYIGSIYYDIEGIFWGMVISNFIACAIAYSWVTRKLNILLNS